MVEVSNYHGLEHTPLGKVTPGNVVYSADILVPIKRGPLLPGNTEVYGEDIWNAYEFMVNTSSGVPVCYHCVIQYDRASGYIVESKSLKLYLNSYHTLVFDSKLPLIKQLTRDLEQVIKSPVQVSLTPVNEMYVNGPFSYPCLDDTLDKKGMYSDLVFDEVQHEATWCTHTYRSLCPVTQQPDFATLVIWYKGYQVLPASLLDFCLSHSNKEAFHEACIDGIFKELLAYDQFQDVAVQGLFTRRGGIDINPYRGTVSNHIYLLHPRQ